MDFAMLKAVGHNFEHQGDAEFKAKLFGPKNLGNL
jgi:hypothetical protein